MRTPNQTRASRANGAKSKGPVTPQGKRNSSRNRTRHGMFADTIVLEGESKSQFLEMLEDLFDEHQPRTRTESMLVEVLAAARWRQDRIFGMQKVAFDYDIAHCLADVELKPLRAVLAMRTPESARSHELLVRYEVALDRQVSRTLLRLERLQARELPKESPEAPEKTAPEVRTQQPIESTTPLTLVGRTPGPQPDPRPASAPPVSSPKVLRALTREAKGAKTASAKNRHLEKRPA